MLARGITLSRMNAKPRPRVAGLAPDPDSLEREADDLDERGNPGRAALLRDAAARVKSCQKVREAA